MVCLDNGKIIKIAERILNKNFKNVNIVDFDEVMVDKTVNSVTVGGNTAAQKLRALMLLTIENKEEFSLRQKPCFTKLGVMLDMSRGAVMKVEALKDYLEHLAMYGANEVLLYMEDTFCLEEYPHFGYLRGAYSDAELKELDDYAYSLGIELIPCVQTLAHLKQYLSWNVEGENSNIADTDDILLCDCKETDDFIEAIIKKLSTVFRSNNIHIGMDEAHNIGLGQYLKNNGYRDRYSILIRHIKKVKNICGKYGYKPMMWSDMFFRLATQSGNYEFGDFTLTQEVEKDLEELSGLSLVYWDYYQTDKESYANKIDIHHKLDKDMIFAGGLWTWTGFLPDYSHCFNTMIPAMQICKEKRVNNVFATVWGDDGCETDYFRALYSFAIFSEYCYCDDIPSKEYIYKVGETVSGIKTNTMKSVSQFQMLPQEKKIMWGDIFYNNTGLDLSRQPHYELNMKVANEISLDEDEFAKLVLEISAIKSKVYAEFIADYKNGKVLSEYENIYLPRLIKDYIRLYELHRENWFKNNKAFGFEIIASRYATAIDRLKYAYEKVQKYNAGEINVIEELEYIPLYGNRRSNFYSRTAFSADTPMS